MKIFFSEFIKNYSTYTFGYAAYAIKEGGDRLTDIYNQGFLPYAGPSEYENSDEPIKEIYYLTRSLRVDLNKFIVSSENRRIVKKAAPFNILMTIASKEDMMQSDHFTLFCQQYAAERFKGGHMNDERWTYLLKRNCGSHVFSFSIENKIVGYVLACIDDEILHYWFSFFDTNYMDQFPIGKYMMAAVIEWAQTNNKKHVYLGTCYGAHSLYKARDFKGAEFFAGDGWNSDISILKTWCKSEDEEVDRDRYKRSV